MARFFIDRPVFAWVVAIVVMLTGTLSILSLPVEQYPRIAPPAIQINAYYPGASAQTIENTVTQVIEQRMTGLDYLRYMASTSDSAGNVTITLTFESEVDPDIAQVQVQNKLQLATPSLPAEVRSQGLSVSKATLNFALVAALVSTNGSLGESDLADVLVSKFQDQISRVPGVGDIVVFGAQHALRIWLNPDKLISYNLATSDIVRAVKAENAEVSIGQLGGSPALKGQELNATILAQSRLQTPEQFAAILLKVKPDGSQVRLGDVARIEIGAENYALNGMYNGNPASGLAIRLATGANALETVKAIRAKFSQMARYLPPGVEIVYPYDITPFVRLSIENVVETLGEAIILVFIVMYVFLQNFRATLIPTIAIPVVLLGTFGILAALGFTINTLTMLAMVLAIGLLVDDAIVVVENVERIMRETGLPAKEATRRSMDQITGALIGIALVLSAVFVPMAFFGGSTGAIYRQFSLTLVSAMALSVLVALVLTPALCATILRQGRGKQEEHHHGDNAKGFVGLFNRTSTRGRNAYATILTAVMKRGGRMMMLYVVLVGGLVFLFDRLPTDFLPNEDQGIIFVQAQTPAGATRARTEKVLDQISNYFMSVEKERVESVFTIAGFNFSGQGQNTGLAFVMLKDWSKRPGPQNRVPAIAGRAMGAFSRIKDAMVFAFSPPAVIELGNASGFDLQLQDMGNVGHTALMQARNQLLGMAAQSPTLMAVRPNGLEDTPQYRLKVDREKLQALGVSLADVNRTLSTAWGSAYVNDFMENGRVKKVYVQADAPFRMAPADLDRWHVRNRDGKMVPISTFTTATWDYGSPQLKRYNGFSSREIMGAPAPGYSSGDAMATMEVLASKLPAGIGYSWTGLSYEERLAGSQAPALYALSILVVFLCLAALYESWSIPFAVMLVVPLGVLGAVGAVVLKGLSNDIYFQVGLLTTVGLSAKNAILIVEFAKELQAQGRSLVDAAIEAALHRLRPILMTSLAFVLGVLPLALSDGAGSGAQNAIGISVMGGMISATVLAIFFVPLFFVIVTGLFTWKKKSADPSLDPTSNL